MSVVMIILQILMALPQLFSVIKSLIDAIRGSDKPVKEKLNAFNRLLEALRHRRETGDNSKIDALYEEFCKDGVCEPKK